jgi:hypothetical protein
MRSYYGIGFKDVRWLDPSKYIAEQNVIVISVLKEDLWIGPIKPQ